MPGSQDDTLTVVSNLPGFSGDYRGNNCCSSFMGWEPLGIMGRQAVKSKDICLIIEHTSTFYSVISLFPPRCYVYS